MPATPIMICEVCRAPLNTFEEYQPRGAATADPTKLSRPEDDGDLTAVHYLHPGWLQADHEPVPVMAATPSEADLTCDFCGRAGAEWSWRLPSGATIRTLLPGGTVSEWGTAWAACDPCSELIKERNLAALLDRWRTVSQSAHLGDARLRRMATKFVRKVFTAFMKAGPTGPFRL